MESNSNDNYVLVLEDRTEVKNDQEAGKLSVVSGINDKGNLKTTEAVAANQAAFLKFNNKDGLLKNFMTNFLKQFNNPTHFGLYKVLADNVEQGVDNLRTMLQSREKPESKQQLAEIGVSFEDYLPQQKNATAIDESKIDWKQLDNLGLTRERLEQSGELEKMLNWQKSNLLTIAVPIGDTTIYTEARLAFRTDDSGNIGLAIHPLRKEPQLDFPYMGYKFSPEEKEQLLTTGNLGKTIEVIPKNGEPFSAYVSIDPQTNEIIALRADRVNIPKEIKSVTLSDAQYKDLVEGKAVKVEGMTAKSGKTFDATLQVNAERKGIEFIFGDNKSLRERQEHKQTQQQSVPHKLCGLELSDKQREALDSGRTLYLKNMVDKQGQPFNAYVRMDKEQNRPRFYKWNPDKKQETGKEKVVAVAEEHKTQVAVNNHGKTNEATKNVKEPLKTGQTQPTAEKPSVARDIARIVEANNRQDGFLEGNGYVVTWAMGHLIALAMPEAYGFSAYKREDLPIRPDPFQLIVRQVRKDKEYISDPAALKQLKVIRSCFDKADRIIVATDAGREGELIFRYIYQHLNCCKPFERLWISSLTDKAIREGLANLKPGSSYDNLYYSAKARSEADWLVGINASRALSIARKGSYSLGRVQTPTLAMVCRRYIENRDFSSVPYWNLSVLMEKEGLSLKIVGCKDYKSEASAQAALAALRSQSQLTVESVVRKVAGTPPPLLYDLTALQKDANRRHGFSADKTLSIAQSLYEKKITTYPRTGSRYISEDVFEEIPALLRKIGKTLSNPLNRHSVDNAKVTDHHAIIPTGETPLGLSADETTIYQMVVNRFIEAFSPDSEEERMQVRFTDGINIFTWKACRQISLGWKAVQKDKEIEAEKKEDGDEHILSSLPSLTEEEVLPLVSAEITEHKTKPKPLYTEAILLSAMENAGKEVEEDDKRKAMAECGIGTPATRANIIETLILRDYIRRDKKAIIPTEKGLAVYEIVKDKKIANAEMTGSWELALAAIEAGKMPSDKFSQGINSYVSTICEELLSLTPEQKSYPVYRCPKCGQQSVGIYAKVAKCRHETCGFHVFREVCGILLSEDNIHDLISSGRTPILKGLTSKAGKKFNARLVLGEDYATSFEFENKKGKQKGR